jgi:hypothetical protein
MMARATIPTLEPSVQRPSDEFATDGEPERELVAL